MTQNKKRFENRINEMISMKERGATYQEIADLEKISRQRVHQILKKYNIYIGNEIPRFAKLYKLLLRRIECAKRYKLSEEYLNALLDVQKICFSIEPLSKLIK